MSKLLSFWFLEHTLIRFAMVGVIGFLTECTLLFIGINIFGLGPIIARIPSFTTAVLVTWYCNRRFTFQDEGKTFRESFPAYLSANFIGMIMNFGIYSGAIIWLPDSLGRYPVGALAVGALVSLVFNFTISRYVIFKPKSEG